MRPSQRQAVQYVHVLLPPSGPFQDATLVVGQNVEILVALSSLHRAQSAHVIALVRGLFQAAMLLVVRSAAIHAVVLQVLAIVDQLAKRSH